MEVIDLDSSSISPDAVEVPPAASAAEGEANEVDIEDESLLSSDETEVSQVEQIELFRFSRNGLSAIVNLHQSTEASRDAQKQSDCCCCSCQIVSFEDLCRESYPTDYHIGSYMPRFVIYSNEDKQEKQSLVGPLPNEAERKDRFAEVVADIERRLNRQGFISDPSSICRRNGGRCGDYYEADENFFDDSEAVSVCVFALIRQD